MTTPPDFEALFGRTSDLACVNYDDKPFAEPDYLQLPDPSDSLLTIKRKMTALAAVVCRGASVAVHTGAVRAADSTGGMDEMEILIIRRANAIAMAKLNETYAELRKLSASLNKSTNILQARKRAIMSKCEKNKK